MQKDLLKKITKFHDDEEHDKIIKLLLAIPEKERDYETISLLARTYNNIGKYKEAVELLLPLKEEGENDDLWHFRLAYAYMCLDMLEEAIEEFTIAAELDPEDEDAPMFIKYCEQKLEERESEEEYNLELYTEDEQNTVRKYIESNFGTFSRVISGNNGQNIRVDIGIINPTPSHNFFTIVTMGMGAHLMEEIPEDFKNKERAELMITLPPDWKRSDENFDLTDFLDYLAHFPVENETWFGLGHTIAFGLGHTIASPLSYYEDSMPFSGVILTNPCFDIKSDNEVKIPGDEEFSKCHMPDGSVVNFYQVIPIYEEEMDFKINTSDESIVRKLARISHVVDNRRENVCAAGILEVEDFVEDEHGAYIARTTIGKLGGVYLAVYLPENERTLENLEKALSHIKEQIKLVEVNGEEIVQTIIDGGGVEIANEWTRKGKKLATDEGECYMLDNGEEVFLPITEEDFTESLYCAGISVDLEDEKPKLLLYINSEPDYFKGEYFGIFVDGDKNFWLDKKPGE